MDEQTVTLVVVVTAIYLLALIPGFTYNLNLWLEGRPVNWRWAIPTYREPKHDPVYARRMILWIVWPLWLVYSIISITTYWVFVVLHDAITGRRWVDRNKGDV